VIGKLSLKSSLSQILKEKREKAKHEISNKLQIIKLRKRRCPQI
jgi:hypothetical protein